LILRSGTESQQITAPVLISDAFGELPNAHRLTRADVHGSLSLCKRYVGNHSAGLCHVEEITNLLTTGEESLLTCLKLITDVWNQSAAVFPLAMQVEDPAPREPDAMLGEKVPKH
jgi:hypothetical protein